MHQLEFRSATPSRGVQTFYYYIRFATLYCQEEQKANTLFKICLHKGLQRVDETRRVHSLVGKEISIEDVVTFNMPNYNPAKKKIDFRVSLNEILDNQDFSFGDIKVGQHTEMFMQDSTKDNFEGTVRFQDGDFSLKYMMYVDKSRQGLLARIGVINQQRGISPARGARDSPSRLMRITSQQPKTNAPVHPQRIVVEEPQISIQNKRAQEVKQTVPKIQPRPIQRVQETVVTPRKETQRVIRAQSNKPKQQEKVTKNNFPPPNKLPSFKEKDVEVLVLQAIPDGENTNNQKREMITPKSSEKGLHLRVPHLATMPKNSIYVTKQRLEEQHKKQEQAQQGSNLKFIIVGVLLVIAAVSYFLLSKKPKKATKKNKARRK